MNKINSKSSFIRPELLAPAGTLQVGLTAFEHGADAVYCGLPKFNARERGENFSFEDLAQLIAYAKRYSKRVYVTLNTLIKPNEIPEIIEIIGQVSILNPDAIIVQDIGLIYILKKYFPHIEIHASTQMGQHNSAGATILKQFNVKRLILERQTTFQEIEEIQKHTSMPLEVFVHGALCCCRSGSCLFSSWLGGWSGNRGKCKQPCRRRYFSQQGNGFFFSPGDLCLIDHLPELIQLGVCSLKIEGRLRGSDYVANVVSAYKMVLDTIFTYGLEDKKSLNTVLNTAKKLLAGSLGRRWSEGFISKKSLLQVIQYKQLGSSGKPCGQVCQITDKGFFAKLNNTISLGNRIRIQPQSGDEGPSLIINKLIVNKKSVPKSFANEEVFIPYTKPVPSNGTIFLVANCSPTINYKPNSEQIIKAIIPLHLSFSKKELKITSKLLPNWSLSFDIQLEPAQKHGIQNQNIINEWFKGSCPNWSLGDITICEDEALFLPPSTLRQLRQKFWQKIQEEPIIDLCTQTVQQTIKQAKQDLSRELSTIKNKENQQTLRVLEKPKKLLPNTNYVIDVEHWTPGFNEVILPAFTPEEQLSTLHQQIKVAINQGCRRIRLTAIWQLEIIKNYKKNNQDLQIIMSFPLPICNNAAIDLLKEFNVDKMTIWLELDKNSITSLIHANPNILELMTQARLPLLESRADIPITGTFHDSYGDEFTLIKEQGLNRIYPKNIYQIPPIPGVTYYQDLTHISNFNDPKKSFNFDHDFV